jgi:hypothetical protein
MDPQNQGYGHTSSAGGAGGAPPPSRPAPTVRKVPFNALPAPSRERFIAAVKGTGRPSPALKTTTMKTGAIVLWVLFILGVAFGVFALMMDDFGRYWRPRQSFGFLVAYMVGFWVMGYGILAVWRRVSLDKRLPYDRGRFVFPTDVVIATGDTLEMLPMGRVARIDVVHQHQNGGYVRTDIRFIFDGGRTEAFSVFNRMKAQTILDQLQNDQQRLRAAAQAGDVAAMADLDPFLEARVHGLLDDPQQMAPVAAHAPHGPLAGGIPAWLKWASVSALAFAILAVPTFLVRNHLSDEEAFADAVANGDVYALREYMSSGGSHADEVANVHLPAAAFAEAQRTGTVTALRDFVRDYPNAQQVPQARDVIHQRFEEVKATFMSQANTADPSMLQFMEALLAWLETNDSPPVKVRFNPPSTEALAEMDTELRSRHEAIIPIAPHFTQDASARREETVTSVLRRGFGAVFPDDVMSLEHAGRIAPGAPDPVVPTVNVSYVVRPSGAIYVDETDNRQFVGIHVDFDVRMRIPGVPTEHRFTMPVEPPQRFTVSYDTYGGVGGGPSEGLVYATMASRAFDQLSSRLRMTFFKPGSAAFQQAASENNRPSPPPSGGLGGGGLGEPSLEGLPPELREALENLRNGQGGAGTF